MGGHVFIGFLVRRISVEAVSRHEGLGILIGYRCGSFGVGEVLFIFICGHGIPFGTLPVSVGHHRRL